MTLPENTTDNGPIDRNFRALDETDNGLGIRVADLEAGDVALDSRLDAVEAVTADVTESQVLSQASAFSQGFAGITTGKHLYADSGSLMIPTTQQIGFRVFYLDETLFDADGRDVELNLRSTAHTNATSPAVTVTFGLYPISASAGPANQITLTVGTMVSSLTVAHALTASAQFQGNSGWVDCPSTGYYCLGATGSGSQAANSAFISTTELLLRIA